MLFIILFASFLLCILSMGCVGQVCYRLVVFGSLVLLPRFLVLRSSEEFVARARVVLPGSGPESCSFWLERAFRGSSGLGFSTLDRELLGSSESFLCLVARATNPSLERACFISADSSV